MGLTDIQISGLREGEHQFHFTLKKEFSESFSNDFFSNPVLGVDVIVQLTETMIRADLTINGEVELVCDRSLESFIFPISEKVRHFFKFGEEETELSDELEIIHQDRVSISFDQLIYDTITLALPHKKLHPKFQEESSDYDSLVYTTESHSSEHRVPENLREILKNLN